MSGTVRVCGQMLGTVRVCGQTSGTACVCGRKSEVTRLRLQCAQESARQVEAEVAERLRAMEEERTVSKAERHRAADLQEELVRLKEEHATAVNQLTAQHCHTTQLQVEQIKTQLLEEQKEKVEEVRRQMDEAKGLVCKSKLQRVREELQASTQEKLSALRQELSNQFDRERRALLEQAEHSAAEQKLLKDEQTATIADLEKQLKEEQNQLQLLRDSQEDEQSPQLAPVLQEQSAGKLLEAQSRFMEEHRQMMETFLSDQEILLLELKQKHEAELESHSQHLNASHQDRLAGVEVKLKMQHQAELETKLKAAALEHKAELEEGELRHQAALQALQQEHQQLLLEAESRQQRDREVAISHSTMKQAHQLRAAHQFELSCAQDSIRTEMATLQRRQFQAMAAELEDAHKVAIEQALGEQRTVLEQQSGLHVIRNELLGLEEHHQQTLGDLQHLHTAQADRQKEENAQRLTEELQRLQANNIMEQEDFRVEKSRLLWELEEAYAQKLEEEKQLHQEEKRQMAAQLQQQVEHVTQLQAEVQDKRSELDTLLQRRNRENEEGSNLEAMLRADIQHLTRERKDLQCSHERALKLLSDVVRTTFASEDLISRRIGICLDNNRARCLQDNQSPATRHLTNKSKTLLNQDAGESLDTSQVSESVTEENSAWSAMPDEGQELSQWLSESMFAGPEVGLENQELVRSTCARLQVAVEKLLELVTESTRQLAQTHGIQEHLEEELTCRGQEAVQFVGKQHQQLLDHLSQEAEGKKQLTLELHKAEGLIEGYVVDKAELEEALFQKEKSEHSLVLDVESFSQQLLTLRQEQHALRKERDFLTHQLQAMAANQVQQGLLEETERLSREKLEIQCQAEKDCAELLSRVTRLEAELEEETIRGPPLEAQWHSEVTDLQQHIQALEKQLKNYRQFMDEQAAEREHERDEFQTEITKLETRLKVAVKSQGASDCADSKLEAQIQARMEDYNNLLLAKEHLEQEVAEQQEELGKLNTRIKELEQALLPHSTAETRASQLEQEVQRMKRLEEEFTQDKESLQQQHYNNLMQISALQSKLDQARHRVPTEGLSEQTLKEQLQEERQALCNKEAEIHSLEEQLDQFRENLMNKTDEVMQLSMQLEVQTRHSSAALTQLNQDNLRLEEDVAGLRLRLGLNAESGQGPALQLPQVLLQEKNQEIDELNQQIFKLQHEFPVTLDNKVFEEKKSEIEELKGKIEWLTVEQERLRADREEETEQLHEVIEKLQQELLLLNPNRHEMSDMQEESGLLEESRLGLPRWTGHSENLQQELAFLAVRPAECKECAPGCRHQEEAVLSQPAASLPPWAKKEAEFQEREAALQASLQHLQGVNGQQREELASLHLQQDTLWEDNCLLQRHISQHGAEVQQLSTRVQELQEQLRYEQVRLQQVEALPARLVELEQEVSEKTAGVQQASAEMQTLHSQLKQRDSQLEAAIQKYLTCQEELAKLQEELAEQEAQSEELKEHVKQLQKERGVTNNGLPTAHSQIGAGDGLTDGQHQEQQMSQFLATHEELVLAKEQLNSNTESIQILLEQMQEKDRTIADLEVHECNLRTQVSQLRAALLRQEEELADQASQMEVMRKQDRPEQGLQRFSAVETEEMNFQAPSLAMGQEKQPDFVYNHIGAESSLSSPELMRKYEESMEWMKELHSTRISELSGGHSISLSRASLQDKAIGKSHQRPQPLSPPQHTEALGQSAHSLTESETDKPQNELRVERSSTLSIPEWISDGCSSNASWDLGVRLNQELERTERLDSSFVEYLQQHGIEVLTEGDSTLTNDANEGGALSPHLQVLLRKVHEEGCRVLALTAWPGSQAACGSRIRLEEWQREKASLLQTIQLLRSLLPHAACTHPQEEQQRTGVEYLLVADGSSLLTEVQALHAHLRLLTLQHQEVLSTSQEQAGPLRRQVDLLQSQLQQEQVLAVEIESSLRVEQSTAAQLQQDVQAERALVTELKTELSAVTLELEAAIPAQQQLRQHLESLRGELSVKENELLAALTSLTQERQKVSGLQDLMEDERQYFREKTEEQQRELQELQCALEQHAGSTALSVSLQQQRAVQHSPPLYIEPESWLLSNQCSQQVAEQLDSGLQQKSQPSQEHVFMQELQRQLEKERNRTVELAAMIEKTQQQMIAAKRQLETEIQLSRQESQREHEVSSHLRSTLHSVQEQAQELSRLLQAERQHGLQLQAHGKRLQDAVLIVKRRERSQSRQRAREKREESQALAKSEQSHDRTRERMRALEEQFQGEQQRGQQLQQMLAELEEQERNLTSRTHQQVEGHRILLTSSFRAPTSSVEDDKEPQFITHLSELLQSTRNQLETGGMRTEEEVVNLLGSLSEISCDVQQLYSRPQARPTGCGDAERAAWSTERSQILNALKEVELQLAGVLAEIENRPLLYEPTDSCNTKMQRLYSKYLRAESFRKALVYQKKYLLLLLGGFQDCEQATLSLIARMGVYPSPSDLLIPCQRSRAFTRFRSVTRVVIAISRLSFLVKKWRKATCRGLHSTVNNTGHSPVSPRGEVVRQQQTYSSHSTNSPPTRDRGSSCRPHLQPSKPPIQLQHRPNQSLVSVSISGLDPEHMLTNYIQKLEAIQHHLGGGHTGSPQHTNDMK
uniref:Pericentrin/AKAP-450 centrosomal targeting domain-containing protein n=1 Tax=Callorhinchus milii TaxID=7868 RepID=A0A4W3J184_CALMI